ncbi:MAG: alpha/beta hydrolase [Actinomycetota bacterium]|nr:alpha/beta hydrolase [Actinomycetota bacterium]
MTDYDVEITGTSGSPVLLLPGGASTSRGFFPGLAEVLAGHRVVSLDRPGTGLAHDRGVATLASGSAAAASVLEDLGAGPAVVVGQSLGGALAVQLAMDHPDLVSGLVLIDPTPVDLPKLAGKLRPLLGVLSLPGRVPVVGARLDRLVWKAMSARSSVAPEARSGLEAMISSASWATTGRAVRTLKDDVVALAPRLRRLDVPVVLLTAERKADHAVRKSHERLVSELGGHIVAPSGAVHAEHLRDPEGVNALVQSVVAEVGIRA